MLSATQPTVEHALYRLAFEALRRRIHIYNPTIVSASTLEHPYSTDSDKLFLFLLTNVNRFG